MIQQLPAGFAVGDLHVERGLVKDNFTVIRLKSPKQKMFIKVTSTGVMTVVPEPKEIKGL